MAGVEFQAFPLAFNVVLIAHWHYRVKWVSAMRIDHRMKQWNKYASVYHHMTITVVTVAKDSF